VSANAAFDAVACSGAIVIVAVPATIPLLRRMHAVDVPSVRSSHSVPTPRGGGLPIAVGLLAAVAITRSGASAAFAAAVGFFAVLGFLDDLRGLPVLRRLALQATGSAIAAGLLIVPLHTAAVAAALLAVAAAAWITGLVNVFNFMDGVNGISGVHALIAGVAYACYAEWGGYPFLLAASLAVAVSALLFLPWNVGRARVFLGDAGSYSLGAALAVLAADAVLRGVPVEAVLGPLALYLADTTWTLQRRIRTGERWLQAHRTHVYQRWCDAGWSHQEVTLLTGAVTILLTLLGTVSLSRDLPARAAADLIGIAVLAAYVCSPALFRYLGLYGKPEPYRPGGPAQPGQQSHSALPGGSS
jgi:UDP-N-acetylmuramyl pentapeptide phosphotransferase/UDP-N-acetylglucosamine-1-phosphate transferase